eukprot:7875023-Alexandrium_andersonii.AAC.1
MAATLVHVRTMCHEPRKVLLELAKPFTILQQERLQHKWGRPIQSWPIQQPLHGKVRTDSGEARLRLHSRVGNAMLVIAMPGARDHARGPNNRLPQNRNKGRRDRDPRLSIVGEPREHKRVDKAAFSPDLMFPGSERGTHVMHSTGGSRRPVSGLRHEAALSSDKPPEVLVEGHEPELARARRQLDGQSRFTLGEQPEVDLLRAATTQGNDGFGFTGAEIDIKAMSLKDPSGHLRDRSHLLDKSGGATVTGEGRSVIH